MSLTAFILKHWGIDGEGSGESIVVASSEPIARHMLRDHFQSKENGRTQGLDKGAYECERLEDSDMSSTAVSLNRAGVLIEFHYPPRSEESLVVFIGTQPQELATQLFDLQKGKNSGRGIDSIRTLCSFLRRGDLNRARACASGEADKLNSTRDADIIDLLKSVGFWQEIQA